MTQDCWCFRHSWDDRRVCKRCGWVEERAPIACVVVRTAREIEDNRILPGRVVFPPKPRCCCDY